MAGPDVRVKLSAEGVDEVVRALAKVQQAAKNAGKGSKDVSLLGSALGDLSSILPQLSAGAAVAGLAALTKQALDTADAVGKLSAKTGVSAETISVLSFAAETADASFESLSKGMIKFNRLMAELDEGSAEAGKSVRQLFGSANALNGLDTDTRLKKTLEAIAKMPAGFNKTKAAMDFFGKSGADLIPLMNDLADGGFEKAYEKAKKFGRIIDQDLANAAQRAKDSLTTMKQLAQGAALQFSAGLAPAIAESAETLTDSFSGQGVNGLQKVGEVAGNIAKGITIAFIAAGNIIAANINTIIELATNGVDVLTETAQNLYQLAKDRNLQAFKARQLRTSEKAADTLGNIKGGYENAFAEIGKKAEALFGGGAKAAGGSKGGNDEDAAKKQALQEAAFKARLELLKSRLEQQLALSQKYLDQDEQAARIANEKGLKDLESYYEDRKVITLTAFDNELKTLEEKRKLASQAVVNSAADEIKKRQDIEAIDAQIAQKKVERDTKLQGLEAELGQKREDLARKQLDLQVQILNAQGKTYQAALLAIQQQAQELRKQGVKPETIKALTDALTQAEKFKDNQRGGAAAVQGYRSEVQGIQNRVASGELFPGQAQQLIGEAARKYLPDLQRWVQLLKEGATTPEQKQAAEDYAQQVTEIGQAADESGQEMAAFKEQAQGAVTNDLTNFFTDGIDQAKNFGDAMENLAGSVVSSLRKIAAQMLANYAIQQLMKAAASMGFAEGGLVPGYADGGLISGPGTSTSDSIPARLSAGEFVVKAKAVAQPGVLPLLNALNQGAGRGSMPGRGGVRGYAEGGFVTASDAMGGGQFGLQVGLEPGLVAKEVRSVMKGPEGGRMVIEQLGQNSKRAGRALGRG